MNPTNKIKFNKIVFSPNNKPCISHKNSKQKTKIIVENNKGNFSYWDSLCSALKVYKNVEKIVISGNDFQEIKEQSIKNISKALNKQPKLKEFVFSYNSFYTNSNVQKFQSIFKDLAKNPNLEILDLSKVNGLKCIKSFGDALENNNENLKELNLSSNEIGISLNLEKVIGVLRKSTFLEALNLSENRIINESNLKDLVNVLQKKPRLQKLNFSNNLIDNKGAQHILWLIERNPTITTLKLDGNKKIDKQLRQKIDKQLKINRTKQTPFSSFFNNTKSPEKVESEFSRFSDLKIISSPKGLSSK